jgi:DNA invertase Pin-like site-specific DNA recombinase
MKRLIGYCRVSTARQSESGVSLPAQQSKIEAMAVVQGGSLVDIIVDAESAKSLNRPGMARLLDMVDRREVDAVIVNKLDRLTRNVRDLGALLEKFERRGVALVSVDESLDTGTAAGRLVLNIMASVSQWEREAIGERTASALQHKKSRGERVGNLAFGFRLAADGVHLEPDAAEQEILERLRELRAAGYTLAAIADELNAQGYTTRGGGCWRKQHVHNILRPAA